MLRPYLVIIKDSFREAIASRVLWILLLLVTCFLAALVPIGYREWVVTSLRSGDVEDWPVLVNRLVAAENAPADVALRRIWSVLGEKDQSKIREMAVSLQKRPGTTLNSEERTRLLESLNTVIQRSDLDDKTTWHHSRLTKEALILCDQLPENLSPQQLRRRNRLLLEAALPQLIWRSPADFVEFTWLFWKLPKTLPLSLEKLRNSVDVGLTLIMRYVVGIVAVFIAILVTAPIVPQTFTSGSLSLLLSKPLSRSLLFLTKYLGGCVFVLIVSGYLVFGLWLIAGLRFDVWHARLIYAIPVFVFLFAIYYSFSALVGVIWKNAVVSIVLTILMWTSLVVVAATKISLEGFYIKPFRLINLITAGDTLIARNEQGLTYVWNDSERSWHSIFEYKETQNLAAMSNVSSRVLGPVYDDVGDQLVALTQGRGDVSLLGSSSRLAVGRRQEDWQWMTSASVPFHVKALRNGVEGEVLLISNDHIFRIEGKLSQDSTSQTLYGIVLPIDQQGPFVSLGPEKPLNLTGENIAVAVNQDDGRIAIYHDGQMKILTLEKNGQYCVSYEYSLGPSQDRLLVEFSGETLFVAHATGKLEVRDPLTGNLRHSGRPESFNQPRFISAASGGRWFAVVFQHGRMAKVDAQEGKFVTHGVAGQGDISAAEFNEQDQLLVVDRTNQVTTYAPERMNSVKVRSPALDMLERCYRYAIVPFYWALPKPGELNDTVYYLLTQRASTGMSVDLSAPHESFDPWAPIWSSLGFIVVVLTATCIYLERTEF